MMKKFTVEKPLHISDFAKEYSFEELRPFYDSEATQIMHRMSGDPLYFQLVSYLWPGITKDEALAKHITQKISTISKRVICRMPFGVL